ncbi:hypothetical protein LWI29_004496 [Acer saccharum]|uniref:Uncharacterized protein n=1 Tax=Acer saccharum TaxID=4024 RepID=A0AA39V6J1_ACESA|nr:hypothetical protein LWI29_004496 [Acer saccharum]
MSKVLDLEDFTTLSLLVVSVFLDSRRIDVDLTITVPFFKTSTTDLRTFWCLVDDDLEDNLEDHLFPLLLVVVVSLNSPAATRRRNDSSSTFVGRFDHFPEVTTHSPWPTVTSLAATVPMVAAPAVHQLRDYYSGLLEPCAIESLTLDPIHPKPRNLLVVRDVLA